MSMTISISITIDIV